MGTGLISTLIVVIVLIIVVQIAKITEFSAMLKGEGNAERESNQINGFLLLITMVVGLPLLIWSAWVFRDIFLPEAASEHGPKIDSMFNWTTFWTGIVFVITQILLFWYSFRYKNKRKDQRAYWFPHSTKLEVIWTVVPSIVLTILVVMGINRWYEITGPAPEDAIIIEVTGKQFDWMIRYPGKDGKLGSKDFRKITPSNQLGQIWSDKANHDDIIVNELHLPLNKPVLIKIHARDVLHSFFLPHFRVKMDAVPGMPTQFWFTPTKTTATMREITGNEEFNYELACAELCGKGHFSMRKLVFVDTEEEYNEWLAKQPSFYESSIKGTDEEKKQMADSYEFEEEKSDLAQSIN